MDEFNDYKTLRILRERRKTYLLKINSLIEKQEKKVFLKYASDKNVPPELKREIERLQKRFIKKFNIN